MAQFKRSARLLSVALLTLSTSVCAQLWLVNGLLTKTTGPSIRLMKDGSEVDHVKREWVVRFDEVSGRLANSYGLPKPNLFITKQNGPNAYVSYSKNNEPLMVVNTEMLRLAGDDDDLMATVIGHEYGHLKAGHLTAGRDKAAVVGLIGILAGLAVDINQAKQGKDTGGLGMALGQVGAGLVTAKFSRDQEREADDLGVERMARAGYDPYAAPRLWALMDSQAGGGSGLWMSSHPSSTERHSTLQVAAGRLNPVYLASRQGGTVLTASANTAVSNGPSVSEQQVMPASVQTAAALVSTMGASGGWRAVGQDSFSDRFLDVSSVRLEGDFVTYKIRATSKYDGDGSGYERVVVGDCSGKRRFEVLTAVDRESRPFNDTYPGTVNAKELEVACLSVSRGQASSAATTVAGNPTQALTAPTLAQQPATVTGKWALAVEDRVALRFVDPNSIHRESFGISYRMRSQGKNSTFFNYERSAVVDCDDKQRFEVMNSNEFNTRPFNPVYAGTLNGIEFDYVCNLAAQRQWISLK